MSFRVSGLSSEGRKEQSISQEKFDQFVRARNAFLELLYLEEKFDLLMENYYEFEREILSASLRYITFSEDIYKQLQDTRLSITRRLANLLSTCRLYLDQSSHHLKRALGKSSNIEHHHEVAKSNQYDANLSYRVLEELRNHAQHRGYPFHNITFSSKLVEDEPGAPSVTTIIPKLSVENLKEEGGFKPRVLEELMALDKTEVDLRPHIRSYVDSLQTIQLELRKKLDQSVANWISILQSARELLDAGSSNGKKESIWLLEFIYETNDGIEERIHFAFRSIERYEHFVRKNSTRRPLSSRFVSSQFDLP